METVEQRITRETAEKGRAHNLKQAAERIADIDRQLKGLDMLVGATHDRGLRHVRGCLDILLQDIEDEQKAAKR